MRRSRLLTAGKLNLPAVPAAYDWEQFRRDGKATIDFIADYHQSLRGQQPGPSVKPGYLTNDASLVAKVMPRPGAAPPPLAGSFAEVLDDIRRHVLPGMVHWQHPGFLAYFPAQVSPPALLGELVAGAMNQPGFSWDASPAATELEIVVMNAMACAMSLPQRFMWPAVTAGKAAAPAMQSGPPQQQVANGGGVIQPSATEALVAVMLAAKMRAQRRFGPGASAFRGPADDVSSKLVCYFSDQSHFMHVKAAKIIGVPHQRCIKTYHNSLADNFPICPATLRDKIVEDVAQGLVPFFINANFGATGTCAIDPISEIAEIAKQCGAWLHVDGAYAGATALCPEHRHLLGDLDGVDSLGINGSKWMSIMFNCSFLWFSDATDIVTSLNATGSYLPTSKSVDLKDYQLGLGRPFRSLKVFTTIRAMGFEGMANVVRRHIILAKYLDAKIRAAPQFEVLVRTEFALVVFRIKMASDEENAAYAKRLCKSASVYALTARVGNKLAIRLSLAYAALDQADADAIFDNIVKCVDLGDEA